MRSAPRPVFLLLATVVVLAVPLGWVIGEYLRGFGVPFGARLGIGLLMVPAIFALTLAAVTGVWGLRERQRSQAELRSSGGERIDADYRKLFELMQELERSSLVRVIGIGAVVPANGITVEFLALELRGAGGAVTLRAHGSGLASPGAEARWPRVGITDDLGTPYVIVPGGGGGSEDSMEYELRFAPAPPADVRTLEIAVVEFSSTNGPLERADATDPLPELAPWRIRVDLR